MTFNPDMSTFHYPDGQTKLELELALPELGASLIALVFLGSPVAQLVKNCLQCRKPRLDPWVGKIPWRRERLPTPVFWPGELHGLTKSLTQLREFHFHFPSESELTLSDGRQSLSWNHTSAGSTPSPYPSLSQDLLTLLKTYYLHPYHFRGLSFLILTHPT